MGRTPFSLVLIGLGCLLLSIAIIWATMPWIMALMATTAAFLGMEVGMAGARWVDEQEKHHDR